MLKLIKLQNLILYTQPQYSKASIGRNEMYMGLRK